MSVHSSLYASSAFSTWNSVYISSSSIHNCLFPCTSKVSFAASAASFSPIHTSSVKPISLEDPYNQSRLESVHQDENNLDNTEEFTSSSSAVALAIQKSSSSPVEFVQLDENPGTTSNLVLPSPDFCLLSSQQLDLFRRIVHPAAVLSVYVRPAGGYVMDRLELRRVSSHPGETSLITDNVILIGNFTVPTGLRAAEAVFSSQPVHFLPELRSIVFPLVKRPFVVGFLVAEFPAIETNESILPISNQTHDIITLLSPEDTHMQWNTRPHDDEVSRTYDFSTEQMLRAVDISNSLALAYVMDQKAMLLQKSSWQNTLRMNTLVDQIRVPLSSIRTLSKLLTTHVKKNEIASDIVEDVLVQGDRIRDTLEELQEAVYLTKTNIMRFNEESLKRLNTYNLPKSVSSNTAMNTSPKDIEMPMPPLTLAPLQPLIRPCIVGEVVSLLVDAAAPLTRKQRREVVFVDHAPKMAVSVEEPALRQALSNLIEGALLRTRVGSRVEITCSGAATVGALVVVKDDGPDMQFMTQMHALAPYGESLTEEDSMTWNFVAGLAVAREILESYGCVVKVVSPRFSDAAVGFGGNKIEIWLPSLP